MFLSNSLLKILIDFKNSKYPQERLMYVMALKKLLDFGERLYKLNPTKELQESVSGVEKQIEDYEIYVHSSEVFPVEKKEEIIEMDIEDIATLF